MCVVCVFGSECVGISELCVGCVWVWPVGLTHTMYINCYFLSEK